MNNLPNLSNYELCQLGEILVSKLIETQNTGSLKTSEEIDRDIKTLSELIDNPPPYAIIPEDKVRQLINNLLDRRNNL